MNIINAIRNWLFRRHRVTCPYCHSELLLADGDSECSDCGKALGALYIARHVDYHAVFVPVIGWKHAGKSVWLDSVFSMLIDITNIWNDCTIEWLTDFSLSRSREALAAKKQRELPEATKDYVHDPVAFVLNRPARWEGRLLILRDVPGEAYQNRTVTDEHIPFILRARNAFIFADFDDAGRPAGYRIEQLMMNYVQTLEENGAKPAPRHGRTAIVVVPKADLLQARLPQRLVDFYNKDPLLPVLSDPAKRQNHTDGDMFEYMEQLERASKAIGDWFEQQPGGAPFMTYAQENHIALRFCLTSAVPSGVDKDSKTPRGQLDPRRVLDPIFWALELNSRRESA